MLNLSVEDISNIEADCYWCLSKLLEGMQDHYTFAQPGIQRLVFKLKELVRRIDGMYFFLPPTLCIYFSYVTHLLQYLHLSLVITNMNMYIHMLYYYILRHREEKIYLFLGC